MQVVFFFAEVCYDVLAGSSVIILTSFPSNVNQRVALILEPLNNFSVAGNTPAVQHLTDSAGGGRQGQSIQPKKNCL